MHDDEQIDVDALMRQVRERLGVTPPLPPASGSRPVRRADQISVDVSPLHSGWDVTRVNFTSHRRIAGPLIVLAKRLLHRLLTPIFQRQVAYNSANNRVTTLLADRVEAIAQQQARMREEIARSNTDALARDQHELRQEMAAHREQLAGEIIALQAESRRAEERLQALTAGVEAHRHQISKVERRLRRLILHVDGARGNGQGEAASPAAPLEPDLDYFGFEEHFRGTEQDVKERQRVYLPVFSGLPPVLDIGCGRGEFLELLREAGIAARGVDLDLDMVLLCRDKGFDVAQEDALAHLRGVPDDALGGIFAAQVIEHLEASKIIQLVKLARRTLRPGGKLVLETPNPSCLMVFARSFYKDFTHIRPIHPDAMRFLLQEEGFRDVTVQYLAPVEASHRLAVLPEVVGVSVEEVNRGIERLNELLYGYQDYAVIATRAGAGE